MIFSLDKLCAAVPTDLSPVWEPASPARLASIENVRQDFAHDIRQGFIAKFGDLDPARALGRGRRARDLRLEHRKLEREMSEDMLHHAVQPPPLHFGSQSRRRASGSAVIEIMRPPTAGNFHH